MPTPTIGLVMIVKDETATLPRLAASVAGQIDRYTIVDTGSTDGTPELIPTLFSCPGEVVHVEWRGFGPSRQAALDAAQAHSDWMLLLDADETLGGKLESGAGDVVHVQERHGDLIAWKPRLLRSGVPWRWVGRTHEFLTADAPAVEHRSTAWWIESHNDGASRTVKFIRDLEMLNADWAETHDPRSAFYLGRTHDDLAQYGEAIDWYRTRISLGGWDEEVWYSRWRLGVCLLLSGRTDEGCGALWSAWSARAWRAEPLATLAEHYRRTEQWQLAWEVCELAFRHCGVRPAASTVEPSADRLFVHTDVYDWRIAYEASIVAWYVDARARGAELVEYLLRRTDLPPDVRASVESNRAFYQG
ncbi:MAG TPA: glycosyltransferase [Mycobacteriales bacterium]|nr:glycosyltransferase [Mycobacteriales bacterium]